MVRPSLQKTRSRSTRFDANRFRPRLESLEDRCLLALYAVTQEGTGNSKLLTIDTTTGAGTLVGSLVNYAVADGIAFWNGTLYDWESNVHNFEEIDIATGATIRRFSPFGTQSPTGEGDLDIRSDGTGVLITPSATVGGPQLYAFDLVANTWATISPAPTMLDGLAFDSAGVLYGLSQGGGRLYTVDTTTGALTLVGNTLIGGFGVPNLGGLAFDAAGNLFAAIGSNVTAGSTLYQLNKTTGQATIIGNVGFNAVSGIRFSPAVVPPGLVITESGGSTDVTEGGATDAYTISLAAAPTANVTITLAGGPQLSVSTPTLTFTPANWSTPQTVTVTAVDDALFEGPHTGVISHTAASSDTNYAGLTAAVTANITDNDSPPSAGVTIAETGGSTDVAEGGATDTYTISLDAAPSANVTITLNQGTQLTAAPLSLVFTASNWNTPQTVTVRAVDDAAIEGNHTGLITHAITTTDSNYRTLTIAPLTANITDNDRGSIRLTPAGPLTFLEGASKTYTVSLTVAPTQNVTVTMSPDPGLVVAPLTLTFTPSNWNAPQIVNVSYPDDATAQGSQSLVIGHDITGDPAFVGPGPDMTVNIIDDDSTLLVEGTEKSDKIGVIFSTKQIQVVVNGRSKIYAPTYSSVLVLAYSGNDIIQFTNPTIGASIDAGTGIDKLSIDGQSASNTFGIDASAVTVNGRLVAVGDVENVQLTGKTFADTFAVAALPTFSVTLQGNSAVDSLLLPDLPNSLRITASDAGTLGPITFSALENIAGGTDDDTFLFGPQGKISGTVNGAAGNNTLDFSAYKAAIIANLQLSTVTNVKSFRNIAAINGGLAMDKLIGANTSNTWNLTGTNAGDVNGLTFQSFENLTGRTLDDTFVFTDGQWIRGKIDGGAGIDVLDYSSFASSVFVNLQAKTASATGGFLNLEDFRAGAGADRLIAANRVNFWNVTGSGTGTVSGSLFAAFESLTGGTQSDLFDIATTGDWLDTLDGGTGLDTLVANGGTYATTAPNAGTLNGHAFKGVETRR